MSTCGTLRLATRGSDLAQRQAAIVKEALEDRRYEVQLVEVETRGDQLRDELIHRLGKTGAFVRALDEEFLEDELDGAIHSMKDMPTEQPEELTVAGIPKRASPEDVLISPDGYDLETLPEGARVGTASLRRRAQLLARRSDLDVEPLRGNIDTRIEKLLAPHLQAEHQARLDAKEDEAIESEGENTDGTQTATAGAIDDNLTVDEWFNDLAEIERRAMERTVETEFDAIVLAAAGIERSGFDRHLEYVTLPPRTVAPAPGQGAIAVTALDDSDASEAIHDAVDHPRTRIETTTERVILGTLGGGCIAPIGVYAIVESNFVHVVVQVYSQDGEESVTASRDLSTKQYVKQASAFADDLADRGAAELIDAADTTRDRDVYDE
ncbi:hydroxymethylbilane synthase [Natronomonas marina]|uniref:hydroxymethylbilane synthase n=1 Tax=Natronomonas marina TaxID=2961939 RepID=UPI0020C992C0|nr:hydroxymethylbilane synthase [Natronomonas marina]